MAKRFTCTDKWKKQFIRGLEAPYKLLWLYILDDCNHAGIWEVDFEVASIRTGNKINEKKARELFSGKVYSFDNNTKWFVPDFIEFQYGNLSETNRAHISVISILKKYDLLSILENKPLISPLQGGKDKDKEKDKEMVKDMDMDKDKDKEPAQKIQISNTEKKKSLHPQCLEIYDEWCKREKGFPAVINGAEGKAMKEIIETLKKLVKEGDIETGVSGIWTYILNHLNLCDPFIANNIKLSQINYNLPNILNRLKNGNKVNGHYDKLERDVTEAIGKLYP